MSGDCTSSAPVLLDHEKKVTLVKPSSNFSQQTVKEVTLLQKSNKAKQGSLLSVVFT